MELTYFRNAVPNFSYSNVCVLTKSDLKLGDETAEGSMTCKINQGWQRVKKTLHLFIMSSHFLFAWCHLRFRPNSPTVSKHIVMGGLRKTRDLWADPSSKWTATNIIMIIIITMSWIILVCVCFCSPNCTVLSVCLHSWGAPGRARCSAAEAGTRVHQHQSGWRRAEGKSFVALLLLPLQLWGQIWSDVSESCLYLCSCECMITGFTKELASFP